MSVSTRILRDDAQETVTEDTYTDDVSGAIVLVSTSSVPKLGTTRANDADMLAKVQQALSVNVAYSALSSPTNAQVATQVGRLTRETTALIRLMLGLLSSTDGT